MNALQFLLKPKKFSNSRGRLIAPSLVDVTQDLHKAASETQDIFSIAMGFFWGGGGK